MSTPQLDRELDNVRVVDFQLTRLNEELDEIYNKQDEMLLPLHRRSPELYNDFKYSRAERLKELAAKEKENAFLLATWTF